MYLSSALSYPPLFSLVGLKLQKVWGDFRPSHQVDFLHALWTFRCSAAVIFDRITSDPSSHSLRLDLLRNLSY
jgi:hypothetical protein